MLFLVGQCNGKVARYPQIRIDLLRYPSASSTVKITDYRINFVNLQLQVTYENGGLSLQYG